MYVSMSSVAFSALTLLVGHHEEEHQPVKIDWWGVGMVICLEQGAHCFAYGPTDATASQTQSSTVHGPVVWKSLSDDFHAQQDFRWGVKPGFSLDTSMFSTLETLW